MKGATSIQERLWELRKDKGLNLEELSELTGISKSALGSYEKEDYKEINHGNLITLADFYGVSVDYLLCRTENREQINTPLTELHLNDEMVALLKSGRINNRLLCELATHKDFIKFLADIEIYVDGIATMQIQNLNALVDTVRHEIIERYRPGEDDPHLKVLQAALPNHTFGAGSRISGNVDFCRIIKATSRFFQILRFCTIHAFLRKSTPLTG